MYETYYHRLQPYFGEESIQLDYMDTFSFLLSLKTENFNKDLKNFEDIFDFRNLNENHELFSNQNKKVIGKFMIETLKKTWTVEFFCLRSKAYSFKCESDVESKNKLKGVSQS